mgnify:CR=1 FL=1
MKFDYELNTWKNCDEFFLLPSVSVIWSTGKFFYYALDFHFLCFQFIISKSHYDL